MSSDSLKNIARAMSENMRAYEATGTSKWTASTALVDLGYQASGLLKLKMQLDGERHSDHPRADLLAQVEVELAEVVALSTFIASELGLDLERGLAQMFESDAAKIQSRTRKT